LLIFIVCYVVLLSTDVPDFVWNLRPKYSEQDAKNISNAPELLTLEVTRLANTAIELTTTKVAEIDPRPVAGSLTVASGTPNSLAF
jgi:hypothetical protein